MAFIKDNCTLHHVLLPKDFNVTTHQIRNFQSGQIIKVDYLYYLMLPPEAMAVIQRLDRGIIAEVQARYQRWFL